MYNTGHLRTLADIRSLTEVELEKVVGGKDIIAHFQYGGLQVDILASPTSYCVCTSVTGTKSSLTVW